MVAKKVAVTDYCFDSLDIEEKILASAGLELVGQRLYKDPQTLISLVQDADFVIAQFAPVTANVIQAMQKCKVIVRYGIGVDNVDLAAAAAKNIPVCNVPDYCIDEVADTALAMILDMTRKIAMNGLKVRSGVWGMAGPVSTLFTMRDMTIGVVGFGRIGREVAARIKAFKGKVLVFDPGVNPSVIQAAGCEPASIDDIYRQSDLITLHCPSVAQTKYMINRESIATMKDGVMIVNTSRGTLIKTDDLIAALQSGKVSSAALDVTDPEPIPPNSPLLKMDNVVINAHIASASPHSVWTLRSSVANTVVKAFRGEPLPNVVNGVKA
jgi:D-3-phosphoglycerate dehydrogenase